MVDYNKIFKEESLTYTAYRLLVDELLASGKTTGEDHSEAMLEYTKMNVQRMNRIDKTIKLNENSLEFLKQLNDNYKILVITEGWCGDASQIVPVINKIAVESNGKLDLKLVLRDKNLPLIDAHLTNGGRAVPVVIVLNEEATTVLASWAPRPKVLQELFLKWKKEITEMSELSEKLHSWYAKDKTQTTQQSIVELLESAK